MTEQEFLAEIQRRQRVQRLAKGGELFQRFAEGGTLYGNQPGRDPNNGTVSWESIGGVGGAVDWLLTGNTPHGNDFQAYGPGEGPNGNSAGVNASQEQMMAAQGMGNQVFQNQNALASQLQDQAAGRGPSLAAMQNQQATQQNVEAAQSMAASQRGVNPALAARMAGQQATAANQQAAGQSAMARLAERRQGQEALGNLYGQQQQAALARQGIWGQQYGQNMQAQMGAQEINAQTASGNASASRGLIGSVFGGIGASSMARGGVVRAADGIDVPESTVDTSLGSLDEMYKPEYPGVEEVGVAGLKADLANLDNPPEEIAPMKDATLGALGEMRQPDSDMAMAGKPQAVVDNATANAASGASEVGKPGSKNTWLPMLIKYLLSAVMLRNANKQNFRPRAYDDGGEVSGIKGGGLGIPQMSSEGRAKYDLDTPHEVALRASYAKAASENAAQLEEKNARDFRPSQSLPAPSLPDTAIAKRAYGGTTPEEQQNDAAQGYAVKAISSAGPVGAIIGSILGMADAQQKGQFASGGAVPALVSGGEAVLSPDVGHDPEKAKRVVAELGRSNKASGGMRVPGKAPHPGDDPRNDTVATVLRSGQVVLPRSVMQAKNPPDAAAGYIKGLMVGEKQNDEEATPIRKAMGGRVKPSYERLLKRQSELAKKIAALGTELESAKG